jgi:O-methyltransferase
VNAWTLAPQLFLNRWRVQSASNPLEHCHMIRALSRVSCDLGGCVVECGSFKGGSAANLSLACTKARRRLHIFDSFSGLPAPKDCDLNHHSVGEAAGHHYVAGDYAGSLEEVRRNITRCGSISVCEFHPGYFSETLPEFREPVVLAFVDVDLRSSLSDCVRWLWPLLQPNCRLYTHEAADLAIASLFFDTAWWNSNLDCDPPGLVGAGNGLGLIPGPEGFRSNLGFATKH